MARPQKEGLEYFSLDVDFFSDRKIKILKGRFGADGVTYYLYLLCEIYKGHGYYLDFDADFDYITSSELGMSPEKIGQMRKFLLERSLFDNKLFQSDTILTSTGIQRRFQMAVKSRATKNPIVVNAKFWLLSKEETQGFIKVQPFFNNSEKNGSYSEKNPCNSENYDTKKSKENIVVVVVRAREEMERCFEQNIAPVTPAVEREIGVYLEEKQVAPELMRAVIEYSALSGAKSWRYVAAVLDSCLREGITTPEQFAVKEKSAKPARREKQTRTSEHSSSIDFDEIQRYITYGGKHGKQKETI